jgi:hypothetical protein
MSRSRYTIHQTLIEIDNCNNKIILAKIIEERACDLFYEDKYTIDEYENEGGDGWDQFRYYKAKSFLKSDIKYYQRKIRERMKLEKELRLLNKRLNKLQLNS